MSSIEVRGIAEIKRGLGLLARSLRAGVVEIDLPKESKDKLAWLAADGRDFLQLSGYMLSRMARAAAGKALLVLQRKAQPGDILRAAGEEFVTVVAWRVVTGGGDVKSSMRPLKAETIKRKGHSRIGVDEGDLYTDLTRAKVRVLGAG